MSQLSFSVGDNFTATEDDTCGIHVCNSTLWACTCMTLTRLKLQLKSYTVYFWYKNQSLKGPAVYTGRFFNQNYFLSYTCYFFPDLKGSYRLF